MRKIRQLEKGFTLIEVLVTMTIIAVLLGLALTSYQGARKSARDGKRKADLEQIRSALEMRRSDCGNYPSGTLISGNITGDGSSSTCSLTTTYTTIPSDPISGRNYVYSGAADAYTLCAALEIFPSGSITGCGSCGVTCNFKLTNP